EAVTLTLPASGITVRVSTRYWQDSKPNDKRLWIAPEMPAPPSAARLVAESIRLWIRSCGHSGTTTIPGRLTLPHRRNKGRFHDSLGLTPAFSELFVGAFPFEPPTR